MIPLRNYARYFFKHCRVITSYNSLNLHKNPRRLVLLLSPFYIRETETQSKIICPVSQQGSSSAGFHPRPWGLQSPCSLPLCLGWPTCWYFPELGSLSGPESSCWAHQNWRWVLSGPQHGLWGAGSGLSWSAVSFCLPGGPGAWIICESYHKVGSTYKQGDWPLSPCWWVMDHPGGVRPGKFLQLSWEAGIAWAGGSESVQVSTRDTYTQVCIYSHRCAHPQEHVFHTE